MDTYQDIHTETDLGHKLAKLDDCGVADVVAHYQALEARYRNFRQMAERALQARLEARGATELHPPFLEVKLQVPSPSYDISRLAQLREILPEDLLLESHAWTPAHEESVHVPDKWDARVFRSWGKKYGDDVAALIEAAKMPGGPPRLIVREKKA